MHCHTTVLIHSTLRKISPYLSFKAISNGFSKLNSTFLLLHPQYGAEGPQVKLAYINIWKNRYYIMKSSLGGQMLFMNCVCHTSLGNGFSVIEQYCNSTRAVRQFLRQWFGEQVTFWLNCVISLSHIFLLLKNTSRYTWGGQGDGGCFCNLLQFLNWSCSLTPASDDQHTFH